MAEITGRKVLIFTVMAFSVIIAVNLTLAFQAVKTFPGLEVKNSYVASQNFDEQRDAQLGLGWTLTADFDGQVLSLAFEDADGAPVQVAELSALVGWATSTRDDFTPTFTFADGRYQTPAEMEAGNWNLRVVARAADGTEFRQRVVLHVPG